MQVQPLYVLWWKGARRVDLFDKRADSPVGQELRVSQTSSPPKPLRPILQLSTVSHQTRPVDMVLGFPWLQ